MNKIITDHKWKNLLHGYQLTNKEKEFFDWIDDVDSQDFIRYRRVVYAVSEIMRFDNKSEWHGYVADSYFSGVVFKFNGDGQYMVGTYIN